MYTQAYKISLYGATTGKLLTSKIVNGSDQNVCPNSISLTNGTPGPWSTILSINDIESVISKYASA